MNTVNVSAEDRDALEELIARRAKADSGYAIAFALLMVADANQSVALAIRSLDESLRSDHPLMRETFEGLALALGEIADALEKK